MKIIITGLLVKLLPTLKRHQFTFSPEVRVNILSGICIGLRLLPMVYVFT